MSFSLKVMVPNLEHRTDRWRACLRVLSEFEFPSDIVTRFLAHDGRDYLDARAMRDAVQRQYNGNLPEYLMSPLGNCPYNYGYHWTFYDMMVAISQVSGNTYTLYLIDDYYMVFNYYDVRLHLQYLLDSNRPVNIIQYMQTNRPEGHLNPTRPINTHSPTTIYNNIINSGDAAVVYHATGAKYLLALANENPGLSPEILFKRLALDRAYIPGAYSIPHGAFPLSRYHFDTFNVSRIQDRMLSDPNYLARITSGEVQ